MRDFALFFKKHWGIFIVFLLCFWAVKTLAIPGFFTIHDDEQIARLFEMHKAFLDGQIPPRWMPDLGFGYGFPLFNFYPPLVYYLGTVFVIMGFSFINGTKLVILLGFFFAALFMYLWTKKYYGIVAGIVASVLYTYASYHSVDVYVRGDIPEFFSFACIPAFFWSFDRLTEKRSPANLLVTGIFFAGIILTHSLVALMFAPFLIAYLLYHMLLSKDKISMLLHACYGLLLGIGLSAFFWLPSIFEKKYTLVDSILTKELASFNLHFVCLQQFWYSPWGYGGSVPGCNDGLSFQVGKIQLILSAIAILFIFFLIMRGKMKKEMWFALLSSILLLFSLFMATNFSQIIWNSIQPLAYLQFPWRFLLFAAVFSSVLGGFVVEFISKHFGRSFALILSSIIIGVVIWRSSPYFVPKRHLVVSDNFYTNYQDIAWRVSNMSFEYIPKGVATTISPLETTVPAIRQSDIPKSPYDVIKGNATVSIRSNVSQEKKFFVTASENSIMRINTYAFPGWSVFVDNKEISYQNNNRLQLITFDIPEGNHNVDVRFTNTPVRRIGNTISLFAILLLFGMPIYSFIRKQNTVQ